jgi:leucyl aminopeptidase
MIIKSTNENILSLSADVLVLDIYENEDIFGIAAQTDSDLNGWLSETMISHQFTGKAGTILTFPVFGKLKVKAVMLIGMGKKSDLQHDCIRKAAAKIVKAVKDLKMQKIISTLPIAEDINQSAQAFTEGAILGNYNFSKFKSVSPNSPITLIEEITIEETSSNVKEAIQKGIIVADAECLARDLANEPPDSMTPIILADKANEIAKKFGLNCTIWDEKKIVEEKMNCLYMVGRGSTNPPRFIQLEYIPANANKKVCIIGKGLCYDSGGLSLKPSDSMRTMKADMSGAAAVIGIMQAVAQLKPNVAVTGMIPSCENMIDGGAYKVDDILRARNGKTIEVDNTDAEGRLALADALSYASEFEFDEIIDMATLTGGCVVALSRVWTAVMGNNEELQQRLIEAGKATGELMWPLPFDKEIRDFMDSDIADIKNSGGREGSAIQGGMFLQEFVTNKCWAHLDIAGTAFIDKPRPYRAKGGTGEPVRAIVEMLTR